MATQKQDPLAEADIWERAALLKLDNEGEVETKFLFPLFLALGFDHDAIKPKVPAITHGTKKRGRKTEADFVVYAGHPYDRDTSLITLEAKHPSKGLKGAKQQAEYYAGCLRTPLYLVSNGKQLEIWQLQPTHECNLVFTSAVAELAEHRGKLESLLTKSSITALVNQLSIKKIDIAHVDLTAYLESLRNIFRQADETIRHLANLGNNRDRLDEIELLAKDGNHTIVGESGSGKTTLLNRLLGRAVSRFERNEDARVPVLAYLPEVVAREIDLEAFLRGELAAHQERLRGEAAFRERLKAGLIFFADAFDRVAVGPKQERLEAQLRAFLRAYPKTKLILTTRPGVEPRFEHAQLCLLPLETSDVIRIAASDHELGFESAGRFYWGLPRYLRPLVHNPFFLGHLARAYANQRQTPRNLDTLFEEWLAAILVKITDDTASRTQLLGVLSALAVATVQGPASPFYVDSLFDAHHLQHRHADALIGTGLLQRGHGGMEFAHEIIADYLRARQLPPPHESEQLRACLLEFGAGKGSSLLVFAMARAQSSEDCRRLWSLVARLSVRTYLDGLHSIPSSTMPPSQEEQAEWIAEEILNGYEELATYQFPALQPDLVGFPVGPAASIGIRIEADVADDRSGVSYNYLPRERDEPRVKLIPHTALRGHRFQHNRNLELQKYLGLQDFRPEDARSLGVDDLYSELKRIIKARTFRGGPRWARERLMARLSQLEDTERRQGYGGMTITERLTAALEDLSRERQYPKMRVVELQALLAPRSGTKVPVDSGYDNELISLDEVIGDLALLMNTGTGNERPCDWALPSGDLPPPGSEVYYLGQLYSDTQMMRLIETIEGRVDEAYREVVATSFPGLESQLSHFSVMPTIHELFVARGPSGITTRLEKRWRPVENWAEHGANVRMGLPPAVDSEEEFDVLSLELRRLGRPNRYVHGIEWSVVQFEARSRADTIVMQRVGDMLLEDLKELFQRDLSRA